MWIATYSNGKETLTNIDRINQITCTSWGNRHFIEFHGSPSFRLKFDSKEKAIKTYWKLIKIRKSTRLNSSHKRSSRMPSSA